MRNARGFPVAFCFLLCILWAPLVSTKGIPLIDIGSWTSPDSPNLEQRAKVANEIQMACRETGFFAIRNHGVNSSIVDNVWQASREFFDLTLSEKLDYKTKNESAYPYGYENSEKLQRGKSSEGEIKQSHADLKETISIGPYNPKSGMPSRRLPTKPSSFSPALDAYYREMEILADKLLRIFAVALSLPENWFEAKMDRHISALRLLNYFEVPVAPVYANPSTTPLRASAHTDYGPLTILKSGGPGLQVKKDLESDSWVDVPHLPNTFVVNLGDMMQRWTNDEWVSTLHRVVLPEPIGGVYPRRQSIAYFVNTNGDCLVDPRDVRPDLESNYPPVLALDHLMEKHLKSMGANDGEINDIGSGGSEL